MVQTKIFFTYLHIISVVRTVDLIFILPNNCYQAQMDNNYHFTTQIFVETLSDGKNINSLESPKPNIKLIWLKIDQNKDLCRQMMMSIPMRLAALVRKNEDQIHCSDY